VSAKIDKEFRKKLYELGIKPSEVIKKALQKDVEERTWQLLNEKVERAAPIISRVGKENWVKAVRESREER
jgi:Arc/MetJ-type ribon-helix-helix transcriptional regulator